MKKKYTCEFIIDDDGKMHVTRKNEGFNPLELLGLMEYTQLDILQQVSGSVKPDFIQRTVVEEKKGGE